MGEVISCPTCGKPGYERPLICNRSHWDRISDAAVHCDKPAHHDGPHSAPTPDHARTAWEDAP